MKYAIAALAFAGAVAAQVDAIPECAKSCIENALTTVGCEENDYACACANMSAIEIEAGPCAAVACTGDEISETLAAVQEICANLPEPTEPAEPTDTAEPTEPATEEPSYPSATETATATATGYPSGSETESAAGYPTETPTSYEEMVTSTIYATKVYTVTSCAAYVTDCPAHSTYLTTETVAVSTTVCPASEVTYPPKVPTYPVPPPSYPAETPTVITSYVGTGTPGGYPTKTATSSQVEVTAGAAVVGSMGGVAALALAALAVF